MTDAALSPFAHVLHADAVRRLSDSRSYERGQRYFHEGRVTGTARNGGRIEARVRGSSEYAVSLWVKGDGLAYSCTCPLSSEGAFCKHCVAVALAWLAANPVPFATSGALADVERYLLERDKRFLVDLLVRRAERDAELLALLVAYANGHR